ncbi:hypothetical protein FACS189413_05910 [Bacteroidia bacterium]|nr:hypothetical protein FACS189413_05910 [Bacteroidia bacterium]
MKTKHLFLIILMLALSFSALQAGTRIYVTPSGGGTGTSWDDATDLQSALTAAATNDEILVAAGDYPAPTGNGFTIAGLSTNKGVIVYGSCSIESIEPTIVNDVTSISTKLYSNNNGRVLTINNTDQTSKSTWIGFEITGGNAATATPANQGGGIYNNRGTLRYCNIHDNTASAGVGYGGGVYNGNGIIEYCIIEDNIASTAAGGGNGGGVAIADAGIVRNSIIQGNKSSSYGTPTGGSGGGIFARYDNAEIINCLVINNTCFAAGGIVCGANNTKITNCTVVNNTATATSGSARAGGISVGSGILSNSIVWGNLGSFPDLRLDANADVAKVSTVTNSLYGGSTTSGGANQPVLSNNNTTEPPLFVSSTDYSLQSGSPAINTGLSTAITGYTTDLALNKRISGKAVDMGAYEYQFLDFVIEPTDETPSANYDTQTYGDIIFKSTDSNTGQLTGITSSGLEVNGIVKLQKTFGSKKWFPIGFPFDIDSIYVNHLGVDSKIAAWDGSDGDFWLQTYDGEEDKFNDIHTTGADLGKLDANTGYVIQFPNALIGDVVTFISEENPVLKNVEESGLSVSGGYNLIANPSVNNLTLGTSNRYYLYELNSANNFGLLTSGTATLKPFESFVTVSGVEQGKLRSSLGTGAITGLENITTGNVSDPVIETHYYNLQGMQIRRPLDNEIYLVKKIFASKKVEITKTFNKK